MPSSKTGKSSRPNNKQTAKIAQVTELEQDSQYDQTFIDAIEDVHTRFILNLPASETKSSARLFFQIEQAWWFYEDFLCDDMDQNQPTTDDDDKDMEKTIPDNKASSLPRFNNVKPFAKKMFEISPLLSPFLPNFEAMWKDFSSYRRQISTYGTILLDKSMTKVVLCQDWSGKAWTFPAGKVNQNESGVDAGARETYEETGFDPNCKFGQTKLMKKALEENDEVDSDKCLPWKELIDDNALSYVENGSGKRRTCFVCWGVPESFPFAPVARKEVSKVEWHELNNLPKKTYAVHPFMTQLKRWIKNHKKNQRKNKERKVKQRKQQERSGSTGKGRSQSRGSRCSQSSRSIVSENDDLFKSNLANIGDENGWDENEMFIKNEELIGRKIDYDGNPQQFAVKGFDGIDPHAFRVVGGILMNSERASSTTSSPNPQNMSNQVLSGAEEEEEDLLEGELKPFFSDGGVSPWGDVMTEALAGDAAKMQKKKCEKKKQGWQKNKGSSVPSPRSEEPFIATTSNASGLSILSLLRRGEKGSNEVMQKKKEKISGIIPAVSTSPPPICDDVDVLMTDKQVTARKQNRKMHNQISEDVQFGSAISNEGVKNESEECNRNSKSKREMYENDGKVKGDSGAAPTLSLREWVNSLPESKPSKHFGDFRFDVDAIMKAVKSR